VAAAIRYITGEAAKVKALVDDVNLGNQEQTVAIEQIGRAIAQMERVTQTGAASAEESAAAAEELSTQSEALQHAVDQLRIMVGAGKTTSLHRSRKSTSGIGVRRNSVHLRARPAIAMHGRDAIS
jgi:hypothetical protein